ncbi:MAG: hypothetical protein JWM47_75 [Acidimicrobiales bacterium]|nr:hypothetical protein [Acidimicrobiales bacterium]
MTSIALSGPSRTKALPRADADRPLPKLTVRLLLVTSALLPVKLGSGGPLAPADLCVVATCLSLLPRAPQLPRAARYPCRLLLAAMTISGFVTFFGSDGYSARWGATRLVGYVLLLAYLGVFHHAFTRQPGLIRRSIRAFVTSTVVVNVLLLPAMPTRPILATVFHQKFGSRLSGALYDPNANGAALAVCLILVVLAPREVFARRGWKVLAGVALAACLAWTFSRGAALGAAIGLAYGTYEVLRRRPRVLLGLLVGLGIALAVVVASGLPQIIEQRYESRPESSLDNRFGYVEMSIDAFLESPAVGAGLGHGTSSAGAVTHATFFWLLGDSGIFAAVAYAWLLAGALLAARRTAADWAVPLVGCLLCLVVTSFSFESLYQRPLWLVLAVAFSSVGRWRPLPPTPSPTTDLRRC